MQRIKLSDGSSWPMPTTPSDTEHGAVWRAVHMPGLLSKSDVAELAQRAAAYEYLVLNSTRAKRDLVCREIRQKLK